MNRILIVSTIIIAITANCNISKAQDVNNQFEQTNNQQFVQNSNYSPNEQQQQNQYNNAPINYNNGDLNPGNQQQNLNYINGDSNLGNQIQQDQFSQYNNNNMPMNNVEQGKPQIAQVNDNTSEGVITMNSDDIIKTLYPQSAGSLFHHIKDCNKYNEETLRVDFTLTKEMCEAILKKDKNNLIQILLTNNTSGMIRQGLEICINIMIDKFKQDEDLKCVLGYLNITNGSATYSPVSTMKEWLQSLPFFKDIEDVAKPFLEEKGDGNITPSYELRASFYFKTGKNSELKVPKKEKLSLVTNLKECEKKLEDAKKHKEQELSEYKDVLSLTNVQKELDELRKNKELKQLNDKRKELTEEEKNIKGKINEILSSRNSSLKNQYNKLGGRRGQVAINNLWCNNNNKDNIKSDDELYNVKENDNKTIYDIIQKYKKEKGKLENELKSKKEELSKLEKECAPILQKEKELEDKIKNVDQTRVSYARMVAEKEDRSILKILEGAKGLFENESSKDTK